MKPYREYPLLNYRVIDGDTIEATIDLGFGITYTDKLRFLDYDAPETSRPSCKEEKEAGLKAKNFLKSSLQFSDNVLIRTYKKTKGKYGRILCRLICDGEDIIDTMISEGFVKKDEWRKKK